MFKKPILGCFIINIFLIVEPANSAEFIFLASDEIGTETYQPDPNAKCSIALVGTIEVGDLEKLKTIGGGLLCLDSPGGSLSEALKIANYMNDNPRPTMIKSGARCESACALIFMAGGFHPHESERMNWRVLHPSGKLGFHSPDLQIENGTYNDKSVKKAYRIAINSVVQTINNLVQRRGYGGPTMKSSLLGKMLETSSEEMFYIDTVDKAGRWDINIGPLPKIERPTPKQLVQACVNAFAWKDDESAELAYQRGEESWYADADQADGQIKGQVIINELLEIGCAFQSENTVDGFYISMKDIAGGSLRITELNYHHGSALLADIYNSKTLFTGGSNGVCTVYQNKSAVDSEPCQRTIESKNGKYISIYRWPSGAKTVIVVSGSQITINGVRTKPAETIQNQICIDNPNTGSQFCFKDS